MIYAVEYCQAQGTFHVETVQDMLTNNNRILADGHTTAYIPLAFTSSIEEARRICLEIEQRVNSEEP